MKASLKQYVFIILAYAMAMVAALLLGNALLLPICNSILRSDRAGLAATQIIMQVLIPIIALPIIFFYKKDGSDDKIIYVAKLKEESYDAKNDFNNLLKSRDFWFEVIFVTIATVIFWLCNPAFGIILINIPLYFVFNLTVNLYLHKHWAKNTHTH